MSQHSRRARASTESGAHASSPSLETRKSPGETPNLPTGSRRHVGSCRRHQIAGCPFHSAERVGPRPHGPTRSTRLVRRRMPVSSRLRWREDVRKRSVGHSDHKRRRNFGGELRSDLLPLSRRRHSAALARLPGTGRRPARLAAASGDVEHTAVVEHPAGRDKQACSLAVRCHVSGGGVGRRRPAPETSDRACGARGPPASTERHLRCTWGVAGRGGP